MGIKDFFKKLFKKENKSEPAVSSIREEDYNSKIEFYNALANEEVYTNAFDTHRERKFIGTHSASNKRKGVMENMGLAKPSRQRSFESGHDASNKRKSFTDKMKIEETKSNNEEELTM